MTFVGKLLVVVQVVLSIFFMAFAGAVFTVQQNWKTEAETVQKTLDQTKAELGNTLSEFDAFRKDNTEKLKAAENRTGVAEGQLVGVQTDLDLKSQSLTTAQTATEANIAVAKTATDEAADRRKEALKQRSVNNQLHATNDDQTTEILTLKDDKFNLNRTNKDYVTRYNQLLAQVQFYKKIVRDNGFSTDPADYEKAAPPPSVNGLVLNTEREKQQGTEYVEISIGSDDGLKKGHDLFVYRLDGETKYLGKIHLVYVEPDRAVGTVILRAKNGVIKEGDNVTTKL